MGANQCARSYPGLSLTGTRTNANVGPNDIYVNDFWKSNWRAPPVSDVGVPIGLMDPDQNFPNGFRRAQLYYENEPPFCLTVGDTQDRMIKVMVEAENDAKLCVVSTDYDELAPGDPAVLSKTCDTHQVSACFPGSTNGNIELMVFCEAGCQGGETPFVYKVFTSQRRNEIDKSDAAAQTIDMWCMNDDGDAPLRHTWPSELGAEIPEDEAIPDYTPEASAASALGWKTGVIVAGAAAHIAL